VVERVIYRAYTLWLPLRWSYDTALDGHDVERVSNLGQAMKTCRRSIEACS